MRDSPDWLLLAQEKHHVSSRYVLELGLAGDFMMRAVTLYSEASFNLSSPFSRSLILYGGAVNDPLDASWSNSCRIFLTFMEKRLLKFFATSSESESWMVNVTYPDSQEDAS